MYELHRYMQKLSDDYWCAGWLQDLEFILWAEIEKNGLQKNFLQSGEAEELLLLAEQAGGWYFWDDKACGGEEGDADPWEKFIPMADWLEMYGRWAAQQ